MRMAMTEGIDRAVFNGDGGANENTADITGLKTASITEDTIMASSEGQGLPISPEGVLDSD